MKLPITQLTTTLWTGGDLPDGPGVESEIAAWRDAGIGVIIDCRVEWSDEDLVAEHAPELRYEHLGIDDAGQRVPREWFDEILAAARPRPGDVGPGVLTHCHMGINRGPSAAYALLLADGHDPVAAIELIRTRRPVAGVTYAEDALDWWQARTGTPRTEAEEQRLALARWRRRNQSEVIRLLRGED